MVKYLRYFIHFNGKKLGNEQAVDKWQEDLRFTLQYNINKQPKVYFIKVKNGQVREEDDNILRNMLKLIIVSSSGIQ